MGKDQGRVGATLAGKYALRRLVGTGAMGEVYEGTHLGLGKRVAVKLMNAELEGSREITKRFQREARAASAVESDYIVQVFDAGHDQNLGFYIVSEFLVGEDLEGRLARDHRLDAPTAVTMAYQLARGLAKAHAAGVVHRDIKPANVFLTRRDDDSLLAKLLDFGISKLLADNEITDAKPDHNLTGAGIALGTPQYMSPEQVEARSDIDGRSDVWSLAAVLYEALSGEPAFADTGSTYDVLVSILRDTPPPLHVIAPWVSRRLSDVVHAGLSREPEKRAFGAAGFADMLKRAMPDAQLASMARLSLPEIKAVAPRALEEDIPVTTSGFPPEEPITSPDLTPPEHPVGPSTAPPASATDAVEVFERLPSYTMPLPKKR